MRWLVADWDGNKGQIFQDVITSLRRLGHSTHTISRHDVERRAELIAAIRSGDYDAVLTWQRFYSMQGDLLAAVAESGIQTLFMDYGFVPHYGSVVFDAAGDNASSTLPKLWSMGGPPDLGQADLDAADELMRAEAARARVLELPKEVGLEHLPAPFAFVPFQRPRDAVVRHDSNVHDFGELLRRVLLLARDGLFVVAKTHPLDLDLDFGVPDRITGHHAVVRQVYGRVGEAICDYLLSRAALVVGINSNMLFRALLFGTPVLATGRGWYSGSGALHEVEGIEGLDTLSVPQPDVDLQRRYVAACLSRQLRLEELTDAARIEAVLGRIGIGAASVRVEA